MSSRTALFQIHYDPATQRSLDPGFIGLDNAASPEPDWFELWPILRYLQTHPLEEGVWYGFVSPRFRQKTGCNSAAVQAFLASVPAGTEVALFSPGWDQLCYFQHPWAQGEVWHPGTQAAMAAFMQHIGAVLPLDQLVTDVTTSVFCNYVVAHKRYWRAWQQRAEQLMAFMADHPEWGARRVPYGQLHHRESLKAFLQERLASYVLATEPFQSAVCRAAFGRPIFRRVFPQGEAERRLLQLCDHFKQQFRRSGNPAFLHAFRATQQQIAFTSPY